MVEHQTENLGVRGSIPFIGKIKIYNLYLKVKLNLKKFNIIKTKEILCFYFYFFMLYKKKKITSN